jgi:hypothetical protein
MCPMRQRELAVFLALLLVASLVGFVAATPPRPGTEDNGLTENESATLWSRDSDDYITQAEYRKRYGTERSAVHQLANQTDITFTQPPSTARTWTRNDFEDLHGGDPNTSVHPRHADLEDGVYIADAHATIFAAQPATRGHLQAGEAPLYVAPNGTLRGLVDYRVRVPEGIESENKTVEWSLADHEVESVQVSQDGTVVATAPGSQTPALDYQLDGNWSTTLTLTADIQVRLKRTTRLNRSNETTVNVTYRTESVTVSDSLDVELYDLSTSAYVAEYPNGDTGVALFQARPWQGYTLTADGSNRVRGVWRFYTARDTNWDTLVQSNETTSTSVDSEAIPVYVHAYPSRIGPRTEPVRDGPQVIDVWGVERPTPAGSLGENINTDVVDQPYTTTYGVAIRAEEIDRASMQVVGIVNGVKASIPTDTRGSERQLRASNLTVSVIEQDESQTTVRVELRDAETGAPIVLEDARRAPIRGQLRDGSLIVAGQPVTTNASGVAIVTIDEPGIYTARYQPGSWLGHNPAYTSDTATVRWHPLGTITGWFTLLVEVGWQLLPFFVALYAGTRLLRLLTPTGTRNQHP